MSPSIFLAELWNNPPYYLTWVILVTFSICVHEAAHAWTAAWRGDPTALRMGYLTLDPLKVMGRTSLIMLLLFGLAWGAVPVNRGLLRLRRDRFAVAFAGPGANLALACLFAVAAAATGWCGVHMPGLPAQAIRVVSEVAVTGVIANMALFVFNLLPVPMLDGWDVYESIFPAMAAWRATIGGTAGFVLLLVVFMSPLGQVVWAWAERGGVFLLHTAAWAFGLQVG